MKSRILRTLGIGAALLMPIGGLSFAAAGTAGASLPTTLTFGSGSSLHIHMGILTVTVDFNTGTDGTDPSGSVAVSTTGDKFVSTKTYVATGDTGDSTWTFPAGTLKGNFTGSSITTLKIANTAINGAPWMHFDTSTSQIKGCAIYDIYTIFFGGSDGTLTPTVGSFRTHGTAGYRPGYTTCTTVLINYFNTYIKSATVTGGVHVS